ncbi:MAG: ribonuclease P protein component [Candidatus Omnitrophica bacterium]|nr:ribonuclease P protein component [Candidatus Omnitrophota bacterium]
MRARSDKKKKKQGPETPYRVKIKHLLNTSDFRQIVSRGKKQKVGAFSAYFAPNPTENGPLYIGIVLPKRHAQKAVTRNYIKRVIYSYFREKAEKLQKAGTIVIRLERPPAATDRKQLLKEIQQTIDAVSTKI